MGCGTAKAVATQDVRSKLSSPDPAKRTEGAKEVGKMGADAEPYLDELASLLADNDKGVRSSAQIVIGRLGKNGSRAAPGVAKMLEHADVGVRSMAEEALCGLGAHAELALPQLEQLLVRQDADVVVSSLRVLGKMGGKAAPAAPQVCQILIRPLRPDLLKAAEQMLQATGSGSGAATVAAAIGEALPQEDASENALEGISASLRVLRHMGDKAGLGSPGLARLLSHPNQDVREQAEQLLLSMGEAAGHASGELKMLLDGAVPAPRATACRVFGTLGEYATPCAPLLVRLLLLDDDEDTRAAAVKSLGRLKEHAEPAVAEIVSLNIYVQKDSVAVAALSVLEQLGRSGAAGVMEVVKAISHPSYDVRNKAVDVLASLFNLGCIGSVTPELTRLLSHGSVGVRMSASAALRKVGGSTTPEEAAELARLLGAEKYDTRRQALETLGQLGDRAIPAAPHIAMLLGAPREDVRATAEEALQQLGPRATSAVPELLQMLTHRKDYARRAAESALRTIGDAGTAEVKKLLGDDDWQVRRRVVEQLGKLGAGGERFVPDLVKLLSDDRLEVAIAAASVLSRELVGAKVPPAALQQAADFLKASAGKQRQPGYWTNQGSDFDEMVYVDPAQHKVFDSLLADTYLPRATQDRLCPKGEHKKTPGGCTCVQPGGEPGLPTGFRVRRVIRVENALMWARYVMKKDAIRARRAGSGEVRAFDPPILSTSAASRAPEAFAPLDTDLNEVYLLHGTFIRNAVSIAKNDFRIDLAGSSTGTMYGPGAYLGESISKADEYTKDEPGGYYDNVLAVLLCRTCMGKYYYTTKRDEEAGKAVSGGTYDSTCGDRSKVANTFRELVVYDNDQLYPEYIVIYHRVHAGDAPEVIQRALSLPVMMELPVYWTNCFRNIAGDVFDERFDVSKDSVEALQRLLEASTAPGSSKWYIVTAKRVENSVLWRRYKEFKSLVRQHLLDRKGPAVGIEAIPMLTTKFLQRSRLDHSVSVANVEDRLNEHLLWHGTSQAAAESIASESFRVPKNPTEAVGLRFGSGVYFSESLDKVLPYASGADDSKWVLLSRVTCGQCHRVTSEDPKSCEQALKAGKNSVLADPKASGGQREVVVFEASQAYPEFVLELAPRK